MQFSAGYLGLEVVVLAELFHVIEVEICVDSKASVSKLFMSMTGIFERLSCKLNVCKVSNIVDSLFNGLELSHFNVCGNRFRIESSVMIHLMKNV